ncbi:hypothetical protein [Halomonas llamarensis]|uniref:DUF2970 domain-containing protein n=1 Tax=Halomonas llamarensis TaxID=2945104 RepID=A0ABT0SSV3_9GAMM|nr:hypothetical protein [Halomonas llamarensis]MCL7930872.1 hypothetical protein [Halomonas llamarensis]
MDSEFVKTVAGVLFAFAVTAIFRWFVMPKLNLVPNEDGSNFFFQALMVIVVVSIFVGSLLLGQYIIGMISN